MKKQLTKLVKPFILIATLINTLMFSAMVFAAQLGLSGIAGRLSGAFPQVARLITGASFLAGLGFAFAAILKFKAHRDNPTQIPIGTPIALILVAAALLYLPFLFGQVGYTLFGSVGGSLGTGGVSGLIFS